MCCSYSLANAGVVAPVADLDDLRATPAPCPEAGRAQSMRHPSDVFCSLVKALWWGGKAPCSSSSPLFVSAGVRLSLGRRGES